MPKFEFTVSVECDTAEQATTVMTERIGPDEEYGFNYYIEIVDGPMGPFDDDDDDNN